MESKINNYKCPNCTAALSLSTDSGRLECQHCGSSFEAEYVETLYKEELLHRKAWPEFVV